MLSLPYQKFILESVGFKSLCAGDTIGKTRECHSVWMTASSIPTVEDRLPCLIWRGEGDPYTPASILAVTEQVCLLEMARVKCT